MTGRPHALIFSVRWQTICHYFGLLCLLVAALNLVTLGVALLTGDGTAALSYGAVILATALIGFLLRLVKAPSDIQVNEGLVISALTFLVLPLIMALPLTYQGINYLDALFETISAVTTTGLSTLGSPEGRPATFLFARAWMQWYGGLGIVVLSLALIVRPGLSAKRLAALESSDDLIGGTRAHARRVLIVYTLVTLAGLVLWLLLGGEFWNGLLYAFAAVSTGGFAPTAGSLTDLPGLRFAWIVTLMCLAGALPLALYHAAWRKGFGYFWRSIEIKLLLGFATFSVVLLGGCLLLDGFNIREALIHAPLMALSAQSTAGFSSLDPATLNASSQGALALAMSVGGNIGSTSGGIKLLRLLVLFGVFVQSIQSISAPPNAVVSGHVGKRKLETTEVQDAFLVMALFAGCVLISWFFFLLYDIAPMPALFEVVSATGTVGLSSGVTSAGLPAPLKLVLCVDMLLGRLEFIAWLVVFYPRTWLGRKRSAS